RPDLDDAHQARTKRRNATTTARPTTSGAMTHARPRRPRNGPSGPTLVHGLTPGGRKRTRRGMWQGEYRKGSSIVGPPPMDAARRFHPPLNAHGRDASDRRGEARVGWARPRGEDRRARPSGRRVRGDLHGTAPDAGADRGDGDPGGRRRRRALVSLGRAHDAVPEGGGAPSRSGRWGHRGVRRRD